MMFIAERRQHDFFVFQLHPEDSLTLRIVGIFIDPTHEKVPLHFRLNFALKRTLLMSPYSACIMNHLYDNVQVLGTGDAEVDSWEMGLVELLYCDRKDAKQLFKCAKDTKASISSKDLVSYRYFSVKFCYQDMKSHGKSFSKLKDS